MLLVAVLFSVSLVGCNGKTNNENINQDLSKNPKANEAATATENNGDGSMMQTIQENKLADLLGKGAKIRCEYQIKEGDGEVNMTTYIDGEKFRSETNTAQMQAFSVFDGDAYYSWLKGETKQGTKMTRSCMEEMGSNSPEKEAVGEKNQFSSVDDIVRQENEMKMNCQEIDEIDFEIPTDVNFIDTCKMMEGVKNQTQDMEQIQKQMEQLQKGL